MTPCMGGWCGLREKCPHFTTFRLTDPAERLCITGQDGIRLIENAAGTATKRHIFGAKVEKKLPSEVIA